MVGEEGGVEYEDAHFFRLYIHRLYIIKLQVQSFSERSGQTTVLRRHSIAGRFTMLSEKCIALLIPFATPSLWIDPSLSSSVSKAFHVVFCLLFYRTRNH